VAPRKNARAPVFHGVHCRQLAAVAHGTLTLGNTVQHWPAIFARLEKEKFRSDLAQVPEDEQIGLKELPSGYDRVYFTRLTERGLLTRTGRGRYKLYHPLFREFLRQES
jgi:hypothetical protein